MESLIVLGQCSLGWDRFFNSILAGSAARKLWLVSTNTHTHEQGDWRKGRPLKVPQMTSAKQSNPLSTALLPTHALCRMPVVPAAIRLPCLQSRIGGTEADLGWVQLDCSSQTVTQKNQFALRMRGLQQIWNYVRKPLAKMHWYFWTITFQKLIMELRSPKIWIRLVKYSSSDVSNASEMPQSHCKLMFYLYKEVKLVCVRSIISCSRVPAIFYCLFGVNP